MILEWKRTDIAIGSRMSRLLCFLFLHGLFGHRRGAFFACGESDAFFGQNFECYSSWKPLNFELLNFEQTLSGSNKSLLLSHELRSLAIDTFTTE